MAKETVDTKVVRMEFDNKQFEKNIKRTSKSLDNFKQELDFKGVSSGLNEVKVKISAIQVAAMAFISNLTTKIINLGITFVKSLSVDNIASGWIKFGEKTTSVATMMAQKVRIAGKEIENLADKTAIVNEQLELLTWFSDETSYTFTDMVNNVGKFTAAGQDLDTSVKAMEGIATWAALSGQNASTASRAMYQLAQAMGKGKIQKIDWMSIQNANMDTEEFRETILATAVSMGKLTQEGDKFITKTGKKFTKAQFADYLSEGWFTSDVLVKGLNKYSAAIDQIYEISNKEGLTASEVIEKYGDKLDSFGVKAFKAAQEARTFSDVINSVKDAVSSKWMSTFELLFGSQKEAVNLWTELSNRLYEVFAESGNFRNNVLTVWKEIGGRDDIFGDDGVFWNIFNAIESIINLIKKSWNTVFPITQMEDEESQIKDLGYILKDFTKKIKDFTKNLSVSEKIAKKLSSVFEFLFNTLKTGVYLVKAIVYVLQPIIYTLKMLTSKILTTFLDMVGDMEGLLEGIISVATKLEKLISKILVIINPSGVFTKLLNFIKEIYKIIVDYKPITRLVKHIETLFSSFEEGGGTQENLLKITKSLIKLFGTLLDSVIVLSKAITKYILPILDLIINEIIRISGFLTGLLVKAIALLSDGIMAFNNLFQKINFSDKFDVVDDLKNFFDEIYNTIANFVQNMSVGKVDGKSLKIYEAFKTFIDGLIEVLKGIIATCEALLIVLGSTLKVVGQALQYLAKVLIYIFTGRFKELSTAEQNWIKFALVLGSITLICYLLYNQFYRLMAAINPLGSLIDSLTGILDSISLNSVGALLSQIGSFLLKTALALAILSKIDSKVIHTIAIFTSIIGTLILLAFMIKNLVQSIRKVGEQTTALVVYGDKIKDDIKETKDAFKQTATYYGIATAFSKILKSIAFVMLSLAAVALIFDKLDPAKNSFEKMLSLFIVITGFLTVFTAILQKSAKQMSDAQTTSKKSASIIGPFIVSVLSMVILLKKFGEIMKQIDSLEDPNTYYKAMGIFIGIVTAIIILTAIISSKMIKLTEMNNKLSDDVLKARASSNKLVKTLLAFSALLISLSIAIVTIAISAQIIQRNINGLMGLIPIVVIIGAIIGLIAFLGNKEIIDSKNLFAISVLFGTFALVLLSIGITLLMLKNIDWVQIWISVGSIVTLLIAMSGLIILLSHVVKSIGLNQVLAIGILLSALATVLLVTSLSLLMLKNVSGEQLTSAVLAMGSLLLAITSLTMILARLTEEMSSGQVSAVKTLLIFLSGTLIAVALSLLMLQKIPFSQLMGSVLAISSLLIAITGVIVVLEIISNKVDAYGIESIKTLLIFLSGTLIAVALSLLMLQKIPFSQLMGSVLAMSILLILIGGIAVALILLSERLRYSEIKNVGIILTFLSGTLLTIALSLLMLQKIPFSQLMGSVLAIAGVFGALIGVFAAIGALQRYAGFDITGISLALIQVSIAVLALALGLKVMDGIDFASMAKSLLILLGALAGFFLILRLAPQGWAMQISMGANAFKTLVIAVASLIATISILVGMLTLLGASADKMIEIFEAIGKGIGAAIKYILIGITEGIAQTIIILIQTIITILSTYIVPLATALIEAIIGILDVLIANIGPIITKVVTLVHVIIQALLENLPLMLDDIIALTLGLVQILGQALEKIATSLVQTLVGLLKNIWTSVMAIFGQEADGETEQAFMEIFTTIIDLVSFLVDTIGKILKAIANPLKTIIALVKKILEEVITPIVEFIMTILNPVVNILIQLLLMVEVILRTLLQPILNVIMSILLPIFDFISNLLNLVMTLLMPILNLVVTLLNKLAYILTNVLGPVFQLIMKVLEPIIHIIIKIVELITSLLEPALELINALLLTVIGIITAVFDSIEAILTGNFDKLGSIWGSFAQSMGEVWTNFAAKVVGWFNTAKETLAKWGVVLGTILTGGLLAVVLLIIKYWEKIKGFFITVFKAVANWFVSIFDKIKDWCMKVFDIIKKIWNESLKPALIQIARIFIAILTGGLSEIISFFIKKWDAIKNWFKKAYDTVVNFGKNLILGLWNGIKETWEKVKNEVKNIVDSIKNFFTGAKGFDIHSPSRVFAKYGKYMMEGLGIGFEKETNTQLKKFNKICSSMLDTVEDALFQSDNQYDYVMNIGMDISSVEEKSQQLKNIMSGISDSNTISRSYYGSNVGEISSSIKSKENRGRIQNGPVSSTVDNSSTTTNNNVFNITSTDPEGAADEIDKILQKRARSSKLAKGAI